MRGEIINTNSAWLAAELTGAGFTVIACDGCNDDEQRIMAHVKRLASQVDVVLCTGGLGPTTDDITTASIAKLQRVPLVRHKPSVAHMEARFASIGRTMTPNNLKQADFPKGAIILPNAIGTAPGFMTTIDGALCAFMPGVPAETKLMLREQVLRRIARAAPKNFHQVKLQTFGEAEATIGFKLADLEKNHPGLMIGYRPHFPEIELKMLALAKNRAQAEVIARKAADEAKQILGATVFGEGDDGFVDHVVALIRSKKATLALAESCTGGLLSHLLTKKPSSDFFFGGMTTYDNRAKLEWLGIDSKLLQAHGAVSDAVARAMAEAVLQRGHTTHALSITGIAGPSGDTTDKPIGLVYVALANKGGTSVKELQLRGDRPRIQTLAAYAALSMLRADLRSDASPK